VSDALTSFLLARFSEDEDAAQRRLVSTWSWGKRAAAMTLVQRAADRKVLSWHSGENDRCLGEGCPCETLRTLAQQYSKHPEFRPEWQV
jgi:hypothetical protein